MMLELILTRFEDVDRRVVEHCPGLGFLVWDGLCTYRGRQGADVALLVRRFSENFRVLKNKEQRYFGAYRTQRLVLAAWDAAAVSLAP